MSEFRQYGQQGIRCCLVVDVDAIAGVVTESNVQRSSALSSSIQATGQVGGGIPFLSGSKSWMSSYTTPSLT
jgi:phosphoribosylformimino-5-aminoimidazole carboxamide ribonucleotide (ProFAR) isomerase